MVMISNIIDHSKDTVISDIDRTLEVLPQVVKVFTSMLLFGLMALLSSSRIVILSLLYRG